MMNVDHPQDEARRPTPAEQSQAPKLVAVSPADSWPGIDRILGVSGGSACIRGTRIPVWSLEGYRRLGWGEEQILDNYPTLRESDLANAWVYVAAYQEEIEAELRENEVT